MKLSKSNGIWNSRHLSFTPTYVTHSILLSLMIPWCSMIAAYKGVIKCLRIWAIIVSQSILIFLLDSTVISYLSSLLDSLLFVQDHGWLQLSSTWQELAFGDADDWWSIPSKDSITLDLPSRRQSYSEPRAEVANRRCLILESTAAP